MQNLFCKKEPISMLFTNVLKIIYVMAVFMQCKSTNYLCLRQPWSVYRRQRQAPLFCKHPVCICLFLQTCYFTLTSWHRKPASTTNHLQQPHSRSRRAYPKHHKTKVVPCFTHEDHFLSYFLLCAKTMRWRLRRLLPQS